MLDRLALFHGGDDLRNLVLAKKGERPPVRR